MIRYLCNIIKIYYRLVYYAWGIYLYSFSQRKVSNAVKQKDEARNSCNFDIRVNREFENG